MLANHGIWRRFLNVHSLSLLICKNGHHNGTSFIVKLRGNLLDHLIWEKLRAGLGVVYWV